MSYLVLPNGIPDFNKAVISFWFRVPKETMMAVAQTRVDYTGAVPAPRFLGILPLLTFGPNLEGYNIAQSQGPFQPYRHASVEYNGATGQYSEVVWQDASSYIGPTFDKGSTINLEPSFVGVDCSVNDTGELTCYLRVRLQTDSFGTGQWIYWGSQSHTSDYVTLGAWIFPIGNPLPAMDTAWDYSTNQCYTDGVYPNGTWIQTNTPQDHTNLFTQGQGPDRFECGSGITITPDKWHHLLLSFDLSNATSTTGESFFQDFGECTHPPNITKFSNKSGSNPCTIWIALDDVNYNNYEPPWPDPSYQGLLSYLRWDFQLIDDPGLKATLGNNGVLPFLGFYGFFGQSTGLHEKAWGTTGQVIVRDYLLPGIPMYAYNPKPLPSQGHPFAIPCAPDIPSLAHNYHHVEMAEFQIFTGMMLDTGIEKNRRAFIDYKRDAKGAPVPDKNGNLTMVPVDPAKAAKLIGREPDIELHKSGNWIRGKNTGTTGVGTDGKPISTGQFTPTGSIKKYKPDPSIVQAT
jgi:hypothetical protein